MIASKRSFLKLAGVAAAIAIATAGSASAFAADITRRCNFPLCRIYKMG